MPPEDKKPQSEREQTDESLRAERLNTDKAMAERLANTEEEAHDLVERARTNADAVLTAARDKADQVADAAAPQAPGPLPEAIVEERAREDNEVRDERAVADGILRHEREAVARALSNLLPLERRKTDKYLQTERVRSDDALANRDDFLGIVSHDMRNLLSGIVLSAATVTQTTYGTPDAKLRTMAAMDRIQQYAARMNRLIGDLVDVASIDAGELALRPERGDVTALLAETVELFGPAAVEQQVSLVSESAERSMFARFDHERMLQVLANLTGNALKFTPPGGRISVRCERSGDDILLSVCDTGSGIPGHMLELVFERLWQADEHDSRGSGLGLYISKSIVESHGGRIWAESQPGRGSTFHFTIPAGESA